MILKFQQRFFSWLDSYDIFCADGSVAYVVKGELSLGHRFNVYNSDGDCVGCVQQRPFAFLPKFDIYINGNLIGTIRKRFGFLPNYDIDFNGWTIEGSFMEWDYSIFDSSTRRIATISKELFNFTDTYIIDIDNDKDALMALMFVLAIDAEKCSRN